MNAIGNMFSKAIEYGYVAWGYIRGPFAYVVNFTRNHPKTTLAIVVASHVLRSAF